MMSVNPCLSIVVAYRNRDILRVERFLDSLKGQTYLSFEVIFVNSGSKPEFSERLELLLRKYGFCRYIHNMTQGMPWNRSLALNSGIQNTNGDYIMATDVDLIFSTTFIEKIVSYLSPATKVHSKAFMIPQNFCDWDNLAQLSNCFPTSPNESIGLVIALHRDVIRRIGGFDEYYTYWGVEDTDFCDRLERVGLKTHWMDLRENPLYHQWHPHSSYSELYSVPTFWYEEINFYFMKNKNCVVRNQNGYGRIYAYEDRPSLNFLENKYDQLKKLNLPQFFTQHAKGEFIIYLITEFNKLQQGNGLIVEYDAKLGKPSFRFSYLERILFSRFRKKLGLNGYAILPTLEVGRNSRYFSPWPDIRDIMWFFVKKQSNLDYYFDIDEQLHKFILVKK